MLLFCSIGNRWSPGFPREHLRFFQAPHLTACAKIKICVSPKLVTGHWLLLTIHSISS